MTTLVATKMSQGADRWRSTDLLGKFGYATVVLLGFATALFCAYSILLILAVSGDDFGPR